MILVTATEEEMRIAKMMLRHKLGDIFVVTGVGPTNVYESLSHFYPVDVDVANFGFAGSNSIRKGSVVRVSCTSLHHPNVNYAEKNYNLDRMDLMPFDTEAPCYSSADFVLSTNVCEPAVFDMELAFIASMGFNVTSYKIVSDTLNLKEYSKTVSGRN